MLLMCRDGIFAYREVLEYRWCIHGWQWDVGVLGPVVALDALHLHGYIADGAYRSQLLPRPIGISHTFHPMFVCGGADRGGGHHG